MSTHFPSPADATFDRPVSILLSCHDKVRHFAGLMLKLEAHLAGQRQQPGGPATASPDARHAAGLVRRYFEVAAPLHHQDEELHVLPRLRAQGLAELAEQLQKMAANKAKEADDRMALLAVEAAKKGAAPAAAPAAKAPAPVPTAFDVGKFAGIFAAIGLAVGALGTALASVLTGLLALKWWQLPIALLGMLLVVSGPAVIMAWCKLRSRNLGPILDANGWAINADVT